MVRRPQISARMQPKTMIDVFIADIAKQIFISRDAERGRAAPPFDLKTAVGFDFGEIADRAGIGHDMAVAHNTAPATSGSDQKQAGQESDRNLIHNSTSCC